MFFFTWISVFIAYTFILFLQFFFNGVSIVKYRSISINKFIFLLCDSIIIASCLYFIAEQISYLNGKILSDFIHASITLFLLMLSHMYFTFLRDFILYVLPGDYTIIHYEKNKKVSINYEFKIIELPYPFYNILYLPITKSVLIGKEINNWLSIEEVKLVGIVKIDNFKKSFRLKNVLFFGTSLFFLLTLTFIKKTFPTSPDYLLSIAFVFWGGLFLLLRKRVAIYINGKSKWVSDETSSKAINKYHSFINSSACKQCEKNK